MKKVTVEVKGPEMRRFKTRYRLSYLLELLSSAVWVASWVILINEGNLLCLIAAIGFVVSCMGWALSGGLQRIPRGPINTITVDKSFEYEPDMQLIISNGEKVETRKIVGVVRGK